MIQWIEEFADKSPNKPASYALLAQARLKGGFKSEVLQLLKKGLAIDPRNQYCLKVMKNLREDKP